MTCSNFFSLYRYRIFYSSTATRTRANRFGIASKKFFVFDPAKPDEGKSNDHNADGLDNMVHSLVASYDSKFLFFNLFPLAIYLAAASAYGGIFAATSPTVGFLYMSSCMMLGCFGTFSYEFYKTQKHTKFGWAFYIIGLAYDAVFAMEFMNLVQESYPDVGHTPNHLYSSLEPKHP